MFHKGCVWVPDHEKYFHNLSEQQKKEELEFREECKKKLPELEKEFRDKYVVEG